MWSGRLICMGGRAGLCGRAPRAHKPTLSGRCRRFQRLRALRRSERVCTVGASRPRAHTRTRARAHTHTHTQVARIKHTLSLFLSLSKHLPISLTPSLALSPCPYISLAPPSLLRARSLSLSVNKISLSNNIFICRNLRRGRREAAAGPNWVFATQVLMKHLPP